MAETSPPPSDDRAESAAPLSPFPDHRDLYLLIAGVALGVLLSAAVLGNLWPQAYHDLFVGGYDVHRQVIAMQQRHAETLATLETTDVTDVAIAEQQQQFEQQLMPLQAELQQARNEHLDALAGRLSALIVAIALVMVLEVLVSPQPAAGQRAAVPAALNRLISVRYALLALWLALVIARPAALGELSLLFVLLVIAVALAVAFVPLGRRAAPSSPR